MMEKIPTKIFSEIQEIKISSALGWKRVSGSGARACLPGDVEGSEWLGECKTHVKHIPKVTFRAEAWRKISKEATAKFKRPVLFVDDGSQLLEYTWCIFPEFCHPGVAVDPPAANRDFSSKVNVSFGGNYLRKYLHDLPDVSFDDAYVRLMWDKQVVHLVRFPQFARWFGDAE